MIGQCALPSYQWTASKCNPVVVSGRVAKPGRVTKTAHMASSKAASPAYQYEVPALVWSLYSWLVRRRQGCRQSRSCEERHSGNRKTIQAKITSSAIEHRATETGADTGKTYNMKPV
jgi:hypothetical protein